MSPAYRKIVKARIALLIRQPFYGTLAMRLNLIEDPATSTASTDGVNMRFGPDYIESLDPAKVQGLLAHEVTHCALLHPFRMLHRNPRVWNEAIDYITNENCLENGFELPEGAFVDPKFNGMSSERVYDKLINEKQKQKQSGGSGRRPFGEVQPPQPKKGEAQSATAQLDENALQATQWKAAVKQAYEAAKQAGKTPGGWEEHIKQLAPAKLPWRDILRAFPSAHMAADQSWNRLNRRMLQRGIYMPSHSKEGTGKIAVFVDTSLSITTKNLKDAASEITGALEDANPEEIIILHVDTRVAKVQRAKPGDEIEWKFAGRGGTRFDPPFEWIAEHQEDIRCAIYITDGYGAFPAEPPPYPTLWVMTTSVSPPWGEPLRLPG